MLRPYVYTGMLACICILSTLIRLMYFDENLVFNNDQGMDLLFAHSIAWEGYRPLVGPQLSAGNFFTPPTYLYLLSLFLYLEKDIVTTSLFFTLMNIACIPLLYKIGENIEGKSLGLIMGIGFGVSSYMIESSLRIWQPYPTILLTIASIYFLGKAFSKKSSVVLSFSLLLFWGSISVYPATIALIPLYMHQVFIFFKEIYPKIKGVTIFIKSCVLIGLTAIPTFITWFVSEYIHNFPTISAITNSRGYFSFSFYEYSARFSSYAKLLSQLLIFEQVRLTKIESFILIFFYISLFVLLVSGIKHQIFAKKSLFLHPLYIVIGLGIISLYRNEVQTQRLIGLFPVLLISAVYTVKSLTLKSKLMRPTAIIAIFVYFVCNISYLEKTLHSKYSTRQVEPVLASKTKSVEYITEESKSHPDRVFDVLVYTPYDLRDNSFNSRAYSYLYLLANKSPYRYPNISGKNEVEWQPKNFTTSPFVYLICDQFTATKISDECIGNFLKLNKSAYKINQIIIYPNHISVVKMALD